MSRAALLTPLLLLVAIAGCGRGHSRPLLRPHITTDECFEERDRLRAFAPRSGDQRLVRELAKLESNCSRRAELLVQEALERFDKRDVEGGRTLLDRALALAHSGSSALE